MTDELAVLGIECYGHHGVFEFEKREGCVTCLSVLVGDA